MTTLKVQRSLSGKPILPSPKRPAKPEKTFGPILLYWAFSLGIFLSLLGCSGPHHLKGKAEDPGSFSSFSIEKGEEGSLISEPLSLEGGLSRLIDSIRKPLPPREDIRIRFGRFGAFPNGERTELGNLLEARLESILDPSGTGLFLYKPTSETGGPSYVLSGLYRMDAGGLWVYGVLRRYSSGYEVVSDGRVLISKRELPVGDGFLQKSHNTRKGSGDSMDALSFDADRLFLLSSPDSSIDIKMWADKPVYEIGEEVTLSVRPNRDVYLYLINFSSSGGVNIVFPNSYQKNNFVSEKRIYTLPGPNADFSFRLKGPSGLERIKVIGTTIPLPDFQFREDGSFLIYPEGGSGISEELWRVLGQLDGREWGDARLGIYIVEKKHEVPPLERFRNIPPQDIEPKPPQKPIDITGVPGVHPGPNPEAVKEDPQQSASSSDGDEEKKGNRK